MGRCHQVRRNLYARSAWSPPGSVGHLRYACTPGSAQRSMHQPSGNNDQNLAHCPITHASSLLVPLHSSLPRLPTPFLLLLSVPAGMETLCKPCAWAEVPPAQAPVSPRVQRLSFARVRASWLSCCCMGHLSPPPSRSGQPQPSRRRAALQPRHSSVSGMGAPRPVPYPAPPERRGRRRDDEHQGDGPAAATASGTGAVQVQCDTEARAAGGASTERPSAACMLQASATVSTPSVESHAEA